MDTSRLDAETFASYHAKERRACLDCREPWSAAGCAAGCGGAKRKAPSPPGAAAPAPHRWPF
eukprot:2097300-Prymnesium_polylepis.1